MNALNLYVALVCEAGYQAYVARWGPIVERAYGRAHWACAALWHYGDRCLDLYASEDET